MHSFQPSRGRILFDVLCALGMVASCVGAWKQTGASALLLAAVIAGLYGFVRLFDLARRDPAKAEEPQRIEFEPELQAEVPAPAPPVAAEPQPDAQPSIEEPEAVEAVAPRTGSGRRKGGSRKGGGRRTSAKKEAKVIELAPAEEAVARLPMVEEVPEPAAVPDDEFAFAREDDTGTPHIAPLFEPEPFVRMPRQAFGRRGRI